MFSFIRFIIVVLILMSPVLIWSLHLNKNVKFELNICERKMLDGNFIVICGLSGSAAGWSIDNNETHDFYDEDGQYLGTDTLIPNSKKVILTCYPNRKSSPSSNKYYRIDGYPGSCKFPFNRGVEYRGTIYEKE